MPDHSLDQLAEEGIDIIFATLLTMDCLGADVQGAITKKIAKINERY